MEQMTMWRHYNNSMMDTQFNFPISPHTPASKNRNMLITNILR